MIYSNCRHWNVETIKTVGRIILFGFPNRSIIESDECESEYFA